MRLDRFRPFHNIATMVGDWACKLVMSNKESEIVHLFRQISTAIAAPETKAHAAGICVRFYIIIYADFIFDAKNPCTNFVFQQGKPKGSDRWRVFEKPRQIGATAQHTRSIDTGVGYSTNTIPYLWEWFVGTMQKYAFFSNFSVDIFQSYGKWYQGVLAMNHESCQNNVFLLNVTTEGANGGIFSAFILIFDDCLKCTAYFILRLLLFFQHRVQYSQDVWWFNGKVCPFYTAIRIL